MSIELAQRALEVTDGIGLDDTDRGTELAGDFVYVGSGTSRHVLLHRPTEHVYKLDRDFASDLFGNAAEWKMYQRLSAEQLPANIKIPQMWFHELDEDVMEAEYIYGEVPASWCTCSKLKLKFLGPRACNWCMLESFSRKFQVFDCCGPNVLECDEVLWLIDLGESEWR